MTPTTTAKIAVRRANERGRTRFDWLYSWHTFSFGDYYDEDHMGFRSLRVINDDIIAPGMGFGEHPHRDMEIITWVLDGALQHKDSLGNGAVIRPGEVQTMTAGKGIRHSEFNASKTQPVHLLQVWIMPRTKGATPRYGQGTFDIGARKNTFCQVVTDDGRDGSIHIEQDADLAIANIDAGRSATWETEPGRYLYVHVARGTVKVLGETLSAGDAAAISDTTALEVVGEKNAEVLLFDLA
jgi:redox-sensitive bicupin YhaK (pirin superfamily)